MTAIENLLLQVFRTPPEPDPPVGAPDSLRVFRASRKYLTYQRLRWGVRQAAALLAVVAYFAADRFYGMQNIAARALGPTPDRLSFMTPEVLWALIEAAEILALFVLLAQIPLTFFKTQLDYHYRWYMTTDRSLRVREGIAKVREQTMMLSNVQNVAIRQGPLQRWLGISDVEVRSAGGGGGQQKGQQKQLDHEDPHVCYFRGVSNATEIRDLLISRLRHLKDSGIGDPDDAAKAGTESGVIAAARVLLDEAKALRRSVIDLKA